MNKIKLIKKLNEGINVENLSQDEKSLMAELENEELIHPKKVIKCTSCDKQFSTFDVVDLLKDSTLYCDICKTPTIAQEIGYTVYVQPETYQMALYLMEKLGMEQKSALRLIYGAQRGNFISAGNMYDFFKNADYLITKIPYVALNCSQCDEVNHIKTCESEELEKILELQEAAKNGSFSDENWTAYYELFQDGIILTCLNCYTEHNENIIDLLSNIESDNYGHLLSIEYRYKLDLDTLSEKSNKFIEAKGVLQ